MDFVQFWAIKQFVQKEDNRQQSTREAPERQNKDSELMIDRAAKFSTQPGVMLSHRVRLFDRIRLIVSILSDFYHFVARDTCDKHRIAQNK